jgi:methionyl-tRNA formyltransferase
MNIFLCGQKSFGREVLKRLLLDGHTITGVAVPPQEKYYDKMHGLAVKEQIPSIINSEWFVSKDIPSGTDLIVAAHSHHFISRQTREKARMGAIGFHPSLLPRHRGRDSVRWTIAFCDPIAGGTIYWLDEKTDGGPVFSQRLIFVNRNWDYHELWRRLFPIGVEMILEACQRIASGDRTAFMQNEEFTTWEPSFDAPRLFRPELIQLGQAEDE